MKINSIKAIFFFSFLFISIISAQEMFVCESYTEDGVPVGPINRLEIKPYGTAIYILLDNEKEFTDPLLYLFIDKLVDDKFTPFDSKTITVDEKSTWAVTSFEFKEPGIYELYFLNSSQSRLTSTKFETYFKELMSNKVYTPSINTLLNSKIVFCEMVINGKPVNLFNTLSLSAQQDEVFIYLNNYMPLNNEVLKVQFWRRSDSDESYEELVDSKKYKIMPEWKDTFFRYKFTQIGEYKIDIFDINDNFISSNIITIIE